LRFALPAGRTRHYFPAKRSAMPLLDRERCSARIGGGADGAADDDVVGAVRERFLDIDGALLVVGVAVLDGADSRHDDEEVLAQFGAEVLRFQPRRNDPVAAERKRAPRPRQHECDVSDLEPSDLRSALSRLVRTVTARTSPRSFPPPRPGGFRHCHARSRRRHGAPLAGAPPSGPCWARRRISGRTKIFLPAVVEPVDERVSMTRHEIRGRPCRSLPRRRDARHAASLPRHREGRSAWISLSWAGIAFQRAWLKRFSATLRESCQRSALLQFD